MDLDGVPTRPAAFTEMIAVAVEDVINASQFDAEREASARAKVERATAEVEAAVGRAEEAEQQLPGLSQSLSDARGENICLENRIAYLQKVVENLEGSKERG